MNLVHFSTEITLGNLAIVVTLIGIAIRVGWRIGGLEQVVKMHGENLMSHTSRLDLYEGRLVEIVGSVQRLIGRVEATQDRIDQRTGQRSGEGGHR